MQITINITPSSDNDDQYNWSVVVEGDGLTHVEHGDAQDFAADAIADAVAELVKNAEIY